MIRMTAQPENILRGDDATAWRRFAAFHAEQDHSPRTVASAAEAVLQLHAALPAGTALLDAARADVSGYLTGLLEAGRSAATVHNRHAALRAFYRFLLEEDMITASPVEHVKAPAPGYRVPDVVPDEHLQALLQACRAPRAAPAHVKFAALRDEAMIRILCEPGSPRASELAALAPADIDMAARTLAIRRGKGGRSRVIALSPNTARAAERYLWARGRHPAAAAAGLWFSYTSTGHVMTRSGVGQMIDRRCRLAGLPHIFPHQLRHTAFSDWDAASGNANDAMALFGWESTAMVHHYGKGARAHRALAAARAANRGGRL